MYIYIYTYIHRMCYCFLISNNSIVNMACFVGLSLCCVVLLVFLFCLFVCLFACLFVCLCVCSCVCLCVCLCACLFVVIVCVCLLLMLCCCVVLKTMISHHLRSCMLHTRLFASEIFEAPRGQSNNGYS